MNDAFVDRKAKDTYVRLRKERDYHRMHHKRVVQEKNRLITDLRRLRDHYACYEPALRTLKTKYETAMKEKMLTKLERDRVLGEVQGLRSALKTKELTQMSNGTCTPNGLPGAFTTCSHLDFRLMSSVYFVSPQYFTKPPILTPTLCGMGNENRAKCCDVLQLESKGRMAHPVCG